MENFTKLFRTLQLCRSMPQYGYAVAGMQKHELSDLAQHHYLVTIFDWILARWLVSKGAKINIERVLEFALTHDLGELFGGDIAMPYVRANPKARKYAKAFENENSKFLSKMFGGDQKYFRRLTSEILEAKSDEALISKIGDYLEVTYFKEYVGKLTLGDIKMAAAAMRKKAKKIKDKVAKSELQKFVSVWEKEIWRQSRKELFEDFKK